MTFIVVFNKNKHSTEFTHLFLHMCVCICMLSVGVCVYTVSCMWRSDLYSQEDLGCRSMPSILLETVSLSAHCCVCQASYPKSLGDSPAAVFLLLEELADMTGWKSELRSFGFCALPTEPPPRPDMEVLTWVLTMHLAPPITSLSL